MKKRNTGIVLALTLFLWSACNVYAGGFQLNEHGARAIGRASAFVASADDPSAIFYNVAGMTFLKGTNIMGGVSFVMPETSFRGPTEDNSNDETDMRVQTFIPPNLYVTHTMDNGLSYGIGVMSPYGLGTEWPSNWTGRGITTSIQLQTFYLNPSVAYRLNDLFMNGDAISIGAGFDYVFANVTLKKKIVNFSQEGDLDLTGKGHGTGFNAGLIYRPCYIVSVGASYRSKVKIDFKGTADFSNFSPIVSSLFPSGDASTAITPPATYFAGISVKPIKDLEVEFDYQGTQWSSYDTLNVTFNNQTEAVQNQSSPKDYKNTYMLRFGVEYTYDVWQFRAGYIYDHTPVDDAYVDPLLPDANRNDYAIGVGYQICPALRIDIAYMLVAFKQRTITNSIINFDGTYNSYANIIGLDFSYHF